MPRSIFVWSEEGNALALAMRLKREGQRALFYVHDRTAQDVGKGLVDKTADASPPPGALVIFDSLGHGALGAFLRSKGHPVIGGNPFDIALEQDRAQGARIMAEHGIAVPETHAFTAIDPAIQFLEQHDGAWCVKLSGAQTYHASDAATMIRYLRWAQRQSRGLRGAFELQKHVEGATVSVEGWFDGRRFVRPFNSALVDQDFLTGNLGPRTDGEANVVWLLDGETPALPAITLLQLEETLRQKRYVGPLGLRCVVDAEGVPHGLAWAPRLAFDASTAWGALFGDEPLGEQLEVFARGELEEWTVSREALSLTLRVTMPPYPVLGEQTAAASKGLPLDPTLLHDDRITVDDVMLGPDGQPVMAGRDGFLGTAGAVGAEIPVLRREVLALARRLIIPSIQYRIDPVERAETAWATLERHGFLDHAGLEGALPREAADERTAPPRSEPPPPPEQDHDEGADGLGPRSTRPLEVVIVADRTA